jgi:hypothetical protein
VKDWVVGGVNFITTIDIATAEKGTLSGADELALMRRGVSSQHLEMMTSLKEE